MTGCLRPVRRKLHVLKTLYLAVVARPPQTSRNSDGSFVPGIAHAEGWFTFLGLFLCICLPHYDTLAIGARAI